MKLALRRMDDMVVTRCHRERQELVRNLILGDLDGISPHRINSETAATLLRKLIFEGGSSKADLRRPSANHHHARDPIQPPFQIDPHDPYLCAEFTTSGGMAWERFAEPSWNDAYRIRDFQVSDDAESEVLTVLLITRSIAVQKELRACGRTRAPQ